MHLYLHLALCRDAVEATAASVALHIDHAQTVAGILAYALEGLEQAVVVKLVFQFLGLYAQFFFLVLGLRHDFLELALFLAQHVLGVFKLCLAVVGLEAYGVDLASSLVYLLLGKFDVELLVLDFLGQVVILAVVAHVVLVLGVFVDHGCGLVDGLVLLLNIGLELGNLVVAVLETGLETFDFVFQVLDFERKLAAQGLDAVNL